jgi:hypothetical protein
MVAEPAHGARLASHAVETGLVEPVRLDEGDGDVAVEA